MADIVFLEFLSFACGSVFGGACVAALVLSLGGRLTRRQGGIRS